MKTTVSVNPAVNSVGVSGNCGPVKHNIGICAENQNNCCNRTFVDNLSNLSFEKEIHLLFSYKTRSLSKTVISVNKKETWI